MILLSCRPFPVLSLACVVAAGSVLSRVPAQTQWTNVGPAQIIASAAAYDSARDRVVAFGAGWTFEFDGSVWTRVFPAQSPPNIGLEMGYDPVRGRCVGHAGLPAETWEYDGATWVQVSPPGVGPQFPFTSLVFHRSRGTLVVLDGTTELWEWNGTVWQQLDPGTALVPGLIYSTLCYDQERDRLVMFGAEQLPTGMIPGPAFAVTWEWDAVNGWRQIPGVGGPVSRHRSLHYDPARRVQVVRAFVALAEGVWERRGGAPWVQVNLVGEVPSAVVPAMVFDQRRNRLVLPGWNGNTWTYGPVNSATHAVHGAGCPGSLGEPRLAVTEPWTVPWLGTTMQVDVTNVPQAIAILTTGLDDRLWGATSLPLDLSALGMPGCELRVAPEVAALGFGVGTVGFSVAVPNQPVLLSLWFFQQAAVPDPGLNPLGLVMTNSAVATIGTW